MYAEIVYGEPSNQNFGVNWGYADEHGLPDITDFIMFSLGRRALITG